MANAMIPKPGKRDRQGCIFKIHTLMPKNKTLISKMSHKENRKKMWPPIPEFTAVEKMNPAAAFQPLPITEF